MLGALVSGTWCRFFIERTQMHARGREGVAGDQGDVGVLLRIGGAVA